MEKHTRRPLERITRIHDRIQRGRFPNCRTLADELEVTHKTVQRDVCFMREELELPLAYDERKHGYFYTSPVSHLPLLKVTAEDLVSLLVARTALTALEGTPLEATLKNSIRQLAGLLGGKVTVSWANLDRAISTKRSGTLRKNEVTRFEKVARGLLENRGLKFEYRKLSAQSNAWEPRTLLPYHLAEVDHGWYVVGHDPMRNALRTFAIQRMRNVSLPESSTFVVPEDFDPANHFGGSLGIWPHFDGDATKFKVHIRFTGWAARIVPERRWHPSQDFFYEDPINETRLVAIFTLGTLEEMTRWVLSWGRHAEVLEPPELKEAVQEHLADSLAKYQ